MPLHSVLSLAEQSIRQHMGISLVSESPNWYNRTANNGKLPPVVYIHTSLIELKRGERLQLLSYYFNRPLTSTKDLLLSEVVAFNRLLAAAGAAAVIEEWRNAGTETRPLAGRDQQTCHAEEKETAEDGR